MSEAKPVKFKAPVVKGSEKVWRSVCDHYELRADGRGKFAVIENPDAFGTFAYSPLFIERNEQVARDKLAVYEAERQRRAAAP